MNESSDQLVGALLADRKSERRWRNFRFFVWAFILLMYAAILYQVFSFNTTPSHPTQPYISLIRLNGLIMPGTNFSAEKVTPLLSDAFADKASRGVVLVINSPGGSPVQASIIHDKLLELKEKYHKKVVVLGEDTLASGSYLVATAADKIFVNRDTITGSIGVIMSSFGFVDTLNKIGVTRRVFTAGDNKDRLDPFKPLNPTDADKLQKTLDSVHQSFIQDVINGRGKKLHGDPKELFSGDFWTGQQAVTLGLVDGVDNLWNILNKQFKVSYYHDYSRKPSFLESMVKGADTELNLGFTAAATTPLRAELKVN